jgi:hypothetical protein
VFQCSEPVHIFQVHFFRPEVPLIFVYRRYRFIFGKLIALMHVFENYFPRV